MSDNPTKALTSVESSAEPQTIAVTGVTGYIAGVIVERLLRGGHTIHGTCRNPDAKEKVQYLMDLPGAADRLKLFKADLLDENAFHEPLSGCSTLVHVASPFIGGVKKTEAKERLIEPAVRGTENVLKAVNATETIQKVVLTSSCAAIYGNCFPKSSTKELNEEDWNTDCSEGYLPYYASKTLAEKKAWEMKDAQTRWTLSVMNPSLVMGSPVSGYKSVGESISIIRTVLRGDMYPYAPPMCFGTVHIDDVAKGHCVAAVTPPDQCTGRHILNHSCSEKALLDYANYLRPAYPAAKLPTGAMWDCAGRVVTLLAPLLGFDPNQIRSAWGKRLAFNNTKAKEILGIEFSPIDEAVRDTAKYVYESGLLPTPGQKAKKIAAEERS